MSKQIKVIEHAEISSEENLFFEHDAEMDGREYITLNDSILYLDTIDEL